MAIATLVRASSKPALITVKVFVCALAVGLLAVAQAKPATPDDFSGVPTTSLLADRDPSGQAQSIPTPAYYQAAASHHAADLREQLPCASWGVVAIHHDQSRAQLVTKYETRIEERDGHPDPAACHTGVLQPSGVANFITNPDSVFETMLVAFYKRRPVPTVIYGEASYDDAAKQLSDMVDVCIQRGMNARSADQLAACVKGADIQSKFNPLHFSAGLILTDKGGLIRGVDVPAELALREYKYSVAKVPGIPPIQTDNNIFALSF